MIAIKSILLPTDGSECFRKAMKYAFSIAKQHSAHVIALHVIDKRWEEEAGHALAGVGDEIIEKVRRGRDEEAQRILQEVLNAAENTGISVEIKLVTGVPFEDIVRLGKELSADLIIMGTHGRRGMSHLLLGSVAERVVRQAPCPVLTVRQKEHDFVVP